MTWVRGGFGPRDAPPLCLNVDPVALVICRHIGVLIDQKWPADRLRIDAKSGHGNGPIIGIIGPCWCPHRAILNVLGTPNTRSSSGSAGSNILERGEVPVLLFRPAVYTKISVSISVCI